ncbi:MAG: DUF3987 domain-containing protein [Bradymonadales bacterium]|nr:MAG: DUF3987 domain-containing protein [Bradymonadales bacterium]
MISQFIPSIVAPGEAHCEFPMEALGSNLASVAGVLSDVIQAPTSMCCQSVLAATSLAVQNHGDVEVDGRRCPISNFFISIAESGERKSAIDSVVLAPHRLYEVELSKKYALQQRSYQDRLALYERKRGRLLNKADQEEIDEQLETLIGAHPEAPLLPIFLVRDLTVEGLYKTMKDGHPGLGFFTDEGGAFVGGYGMGKDHELKTMACLSDTWDGKPIARVRAGEESLVLRGRRVSLHIMLQPIAFKKLLSSGIASGQGFLSRALCVYPHSRKGRRRYVETDISKVPSIIRFQTRIGELLRMQPSLAPGSRNELNPPVLTLTPNAKKLFIEQSNFIEEKLGKSGPYASIDSFASKAPEHALRLAATICLYEDAETSQIDEECMTRGFALIAFYLNQSLKVVGDAHAERLSDLAVQLEEWLLLKGLKEIDSRFLQQYAPNALRKGQVLNMVVKLLESQGVMIPIAGGKVIDGVHRRQVWEVRL